MADWPVNGNIAYCGYYACSIEPSADNTKSAYTEMFSAIPKDITSIAIYSTCGNPGSWMADLAVGSAGNEVPIIENLFVDTSKNREVFYPVFPISIPKGTRLSIRAQCSGVVARQYGYGLFLFSGGYLCPRGKNKVITLGANTTDTGGTSIDPGTSAGMYGDWVEMSPSLEENTDYLIMAFGRQGDTDRSSADWTLQVGVGSEGNETVVLENLVVKCHSDDDTIWPRFFSFPFSFAKGQRISVRAKSTITDSNRTFDLIMYLV